MERPKTTTPTVPSALTIFDSPIAMDFDDFLPVVGEFGTYQKMLILLMLPFTLFGALVYFAQIFMTLVPKKHWCEVPELNALTVEERLALSIPLEKGEYSNCRMYDVNYTQLLAEEVRQADSAWPQTPCRSGWAYNHTEIPYSTIATELNWVCEKSALGAYAQFIFFLGSIFGGLLFGWVADRYGRVPALVACNLVGFVGGVATAFVKSFWTFSIMRFIVGFAYDSGFILMYILVLEYVGPMYRTIVANVAIAIFFTGCACSLPWIALSLANWRHFALATSVPLILVVIAPFIMPESARWLVLQGKVEQAIRILKRMEHVNGKTVPEETYREFETSCRRIFLAESVNKKRHTIADLFRTPRLRKTTIVLIVTWMANVLVFDGMVRNVGWLGWDLFLTFTVANFTECPAAILVIFTLDRCGRRWLACGTLLLSGVFSFLAIVTPMGAYATSMAIVGRFFINISVNIGLQYAAELLPTVVRGEGVAFIHIMGRVGQIMGPFVVYLNIISPQLPLVIFGVIGIVGGLLSMLLPETLNHDLPETLQDGENFGLGQGFWYAPCLSKNVKK